jgi:glycosyltransferase involved in cell wall biosynthesis
LSKPKILFINRSYWPDAEATGQLLTELCEQLSDQFEIHVVAGQPNSNPAGETFKSTGAQLHKNVLVHRVNHTQYKKSSSVGRIVNLVSFFISALWQTIKLPRMSIVVMETDPFLLPFGTALLNWSHRAKMVYYLQDIYPDIAVAVKMARENWIIKLLRELLFQNYRQAAAVVVLSRDMKQLCMSHGVPVDIIKVIPNWCDVHQIIPLQHNNPIRMNYSWRDKFIIMHSGNMGMSQRLETVLEVANLLKVKHPDIHFALVGGGAQEENLKKKAADLELHNVSFLPYQPKHKLAESLSSADLHLISSDKAALNCLMPSKLYGILSSGSPILALVNEESELAEIIQQNGCGVVVSHENQKLIANTIVELFQDQTKLKMMAANSRNYALDNCDINHSVNMFRELFSELTCLTQVTTTAA